MSYFDFIEWQRNHRNTEFNRDMSEYWGPTRPGRYIPASHFSDAVHHPSSRHAALFRERLDVRPEVPKVYLDAFDDPEALRPTKEG